MVCSAPSLQQLCATKIAVRIWCKKDLATIMTAGKIAEEKLNSLGLPKTLREDLRSVVTSIGLEIFRWYFSTNFILKMLAPKLPAEYRVTPDGRIDRKKTMELVVNDERFPLERRFQLACIFHLREECVYALWKKQPRVEKVLDFKDRIIDALKYQLVVSVWTRILSLEDVETKTNNEEEKLMRLKNLLHKLYIIPTYDHGLYGPPE